MTREDSYGIIWQLDVFVFLVLLLLNFLGSGTRLLHSCANLLLMDGCSTQTACRNNLIGEL